LQEKVRATPHKDCGVIAPEDFLSDEAKNVGNPLWIHEAFFEIWRKIGKLASRKAVRRSFCGVALGYTGLRVCPYEHSYQNRFCRNWVIILVGAIFIMV